VFVANRLINSGAIGILLGGSAICQAVREENSVLPSHASSTPTAMHFVQNPPPRLIPCGRSCRD
jgi:hypothetical protein